MSDQNLGNLYVKLKADVAEFQSKMEGAAKTLEKVGKKMEGIGLASLEVAGGLGVLGFELVKTAADSEATENLLAAAFGSMAAAAQDWSETTGKALHRSGDMMREFASSLQTTLVPLTGNTLAAGQMSEGLAELAVKLGSAFNLSDDTEALDALQHAMLGNERGVKRFGISMDAASLQAFALSKGMLRNVANMNSAQLATLRYNFLLENTKIQQAAATANAGGFTEAMKRLKSQLHDVAEELGTRLKPFAADLVEKLSRLVQAFKDLDGPTKNFILRTAVVVGIIATLGATLLPLGKLVSVFASIAGFLAPAIVPLLEVVGIVAGLVAGLGAMKLAWDKNLFGIRDGVAHLKDWFNDLLDVWFNAMDKILQGAEAIFYAFKNRDWKGALKGLYDIQMAPLRTLGDIASGTTPTSSLADKAGLAKDIGDTAVDWGKSAASWLGDGLTASLSGLQDSLKAGADVIAGLMPEGFLGGLGATFNSFLAGFKEMLGKIGSEGGHPHLPPGATAGDVTAGKEKQFTLMGGLKALSPLAPTGALGGVVAGATQGMAAGPVGAGIGAFAALLSQSSAFAGVMQTLNSIVGTVAQELGQALRPLVPVIILVAQMFRVGLMPVIAVIALQLKILTPVLKVLFNAVRDVSLAILQAAKKLLNAIGVHSSALNHAIKDLKDASWDASFGVTALGTAAGAATAALLNLPQGFKVAAYRFAATATGPNNGMQVGTAGGLGGTPNAPGSQAPYNSRSSAATSSGPGSAGTMNVTIYASDTVELWRKLKKQAERDNYRTRGTIVPITSPFGSRG